MRRRVAIFPDDSACASLGEGVPSPAAAGGPPSGVARPLAARSTVLGGTCAASAAMADTMRCSRSSASSSFALRRDARTSTAIPTCQESGLCKVCTLMPSQSHAWWHYRRITFTFAVNVSDMIPEHGQAPCSGKGAEVRLT